ncbi:MAG: hypothetical protein K8S16_13170 [Bacteroidales bacterium]|nr:hypothetical protein [Bacteroidales bacterium]
MFLGNRAGQNEQGSDRLYIENSEVDSSWALIYGEFDNDLLVFNNRVGIGIYPSDTANANLVVEGNIRVANGSFIDDGTALNVPDYVFELDYKLESIEEHSELMWSKKHLPAVTSAEEIKNSNGYNISERREQMLEELEKAHIYIEQLNNHIKELEKANKQLTERVETIEKSIKE